MFILGKKSVLSVETVLVKRVCCARLLENCPLTKGQFGHAETQSSDGYLKQQSLGRQRRFGTRRALG